MSASGPAVDELAELRAQLAALRADNAALREQVTSQRHTEEQLYLLQGQLDRQLRLVRRLYELGQQFDQFREPGQVFAELPPFVRDDLGYQRAVVFGGGRTGALRVRACAGYDEAHEASAVAALVLPREGALLTAMQPGQLVVHGKGADLPTDSERGPMSRLPSSNQGAVSELARALGLHEFLALPLYAGTALVGLLVAGNHDPISGVHAPAHADAEAAYGLGNLAALAGTALDSCLLYEDLVHERTLLERKVAERTRELSRAYEDLARLDTLKSQFFANVSHELRTPLTLSLAPLEEMLARGPTLEATTRDEFLQTIYNNQLRLLRLINNLLDFSRLDAGQMTASFQLEDVTDAVRFYVGSLSNAAQIRRLGLHFASEGPPQLLFVDHDKFEKIVMNLLSNAFKFTPPGGRIDVRLRDEGEVVALEVADTGVGMPAEQLARLFERFGQTQAGDKRPFEGAGIGLAMARAFVALHGGSIDVASEPGKGATFTVRLRKGDAHLDSESIMAGRAATPERVNPHDLAEPHLTEPPAVDDAADTVSDVEAPTPIAQLSPSSDDRLMASFATDGATVLVVDDVADMRRFVAHILGKRYRVLLARDGVEGLRRARLEHPDLIVSDVMMPRMTGYELCRAVRNDPELARTPIILLSAKADLARKLEGLEHGADDYLVKPFNASELTTRVRNLIRIHHQERELTNALRALEERERVLMDDLRQAREFQQSILPRPPQVAGLVVDVLYQPLDLVGGDIYDLQALDGGRLRVFLADAAGHGVQASLTTMLIKSEYESAKRNDAPPAEVLARLNDRIARTYSALGMRFTAACFEVDMRQRRVRYASGAHPAPILVHHGQASELEASGPFLGLMSGVGFEQFEAPFGPGDRIYLYTDGITEEWNAAGDAFGEDRLRQAIERAADQGALAGSIVYDDVSRFIEGGTEQYDDLALVGVWWGQPSGYDKERQ